MRFLLPLLFLCFYGYSQSVVHYIGPVSSNQKNTLFAKEQYIYVTSPYQDGPVYIKISKFGQFQTEIFSMDVGRSISYRVGDDDETPLVIVDGDLGKNLSDKGMKVEVLEMLVLHYPLPFLLRQGFRQEIITQTLKLSILAGIQLMVMMNLMTVALLLTTRKIMHISGGMGYGMTYLIIQTYHSLLNLTIMWMILVMVIYFLGLLMGTATLFQNQLIPGLIRGL